MTMVEDSCHGTPRLWCVLWEVYFLKPQRGHRFIRASPSGVPLIPSY